MNAKEPGKVFGEAGRPLVDAPAKHGTAFSITLSGPNEIQSSGLGRRSEIRYYRLGEDLDRHLAEFLQKASVGHSPIDRQGPYPVPHPKIERVPGFGLVEFLGHFSRQNFRERVLEATHADLIAQYEESLALGNEKRARIQKRMIVVWLLIATFKGALLGLLSKLSLKSVSSPE
jgi:hypothetical protein